MGDFLKNMVIRPGLERLGTVGAVWLLATTDMWCAVHNVCGVTPQVVDALVLAMQVGGMIAFDWAVIAFNRSRAK